MHMLTCILWITTTAMLDFNRLFPMFSWNGSSDEVCLCFHWSSLSVQMFCVINQKFKVFDPVTWKIFRKQKRVAESGANFIPSHFIYLHWYCYWLISRFYSWTQASKQVAMISGPTIIHNCEFHMFFCWINKQHCKGATRYNLRFTFRFSHSYSWKFCAKFIAAYQMNSTHNIMDDVFFFLEWFRLMRSVAFFLKQKAMW